MAPEPHPPHEPNPLRSQALLSTALAAVLAALVILTLLGHNRLTDWDEGIYAQVSREMLQSGWLVPHWNSLVWIDKPPLTYWITALFFKLFGVSELTARLGSALSAIAIVTVLHAWLLRTRDNFTAWLSTVILLSTFGFLHVARVGETDTLLSFGSLLALIGLADLLLPSERPSLNGWYLYWTGFAIALMSKSAASGTLFLTLLVLLAIDPILRRRVRAPFFYGLLLFLALTLPWHLFMLHRFGQVFVRQYLGLHVLGRVAYQFDGHLTPWWYYLRVLLFSAPPWVLLYPVALYATFRTPTLRYLRPFAVFALVQTLFFSCVQTRLPHYMAPAYAPLSALVAIWLAIWIQRRSAILSQREDAVILSQRENAVILSGARSAQPKDPDAVYPAPTPSTLSTHTLLRFRLQLITAGVVIWILTALLTAHPRSRLHSPALPNGQITPNNREETALLKQVFQHPTLLVANTPGPLLDGRPGSYNPIPTVLFYANRPVQQVALQPLPPNTPTDIYAFNPIPLAQAVTTQPRLLLISRSLVPQIPANYTFQPIATSPTLELGRIFRLP
jgi:4-amino-4-deoxy-L-arabinose transferase-like glycosyltransferase